ncbi:hypothetical protein BH11MYX3_BH11MYX3_34800 [soil metagenome]
MVKMLRRVVPLVAVLAGCGFQIAADNGGGDPDASVDDTIGGSDGGGDDIPPTTTKRRVKLSFNNASRAIVRDNFVALVVRDPNRVDYSLINAGGANLRFTDPDGTQLPYQIDEWNPAGSSYVWVRVPAIDATNTDYIYMHYGDPALADAQAPATVWTGHSAVWHLSQDPGPGGLGEIRDATGAHHGTATESMTPADRVASVIGNGMYFAGSGQGITATTIIAPTYTWTMWIRGTTVPAVASSNKEPINNGDLNFNFSWDHSQAAYVGAAAQRDATQWRSSAPGGIAANTWYFLAGTYDGTSLCAYRDVSASSCVSAGAPLAPVGTFTLGLAASGAATFTGWIDEVRVLPTALSPKRLDAELVNQRASDANPFVVFSAPELEP